MRIILAVVPLAVLAGCGATAKAPPIAISAVVPASIARSVSGLDRVMGKDARALVSLFGAADQDVQEPGARKLQFGSGTCTLDAYLYPPAQGREPVVTYVDARALDGKDVDKVACVSALAKR
jgi:hypothetical protein